MNTTLRQNTQIPSEQMHGFLKDKNAWENAISMYQGPDPLDHWYNYICWYENHRHGDPENQFRQTLERCLSIFEHTDYYKQDVRMVRLWLKYIDMQPNPLHFFQVLHTRGVGKQVAAFYISWANYYESVNALKEAEAVYNVAFKEKAQSYAELHHAHSKFIFAHSANTATQPATATAPIQTHISQQQYHQQPVQQNVQQTTNHSHEVVQQNPYGQTTATTTTTVERQQVAIQQTHDPQVQIQNQAQTQPQAQLQQQPQVIVHHHANAAQLNHGYRQQVIYHHQSQQQQIQHHQHVTLQLQQQQQQTPYQQRVEVNSYNHAVSPAHHHIQSQQHPVHQQQQFQQAQVNNQQTTYLQHQLAQPITSSVGVPVEQQLPATNAQNVTQTQAQYYQAQQLQQQQLRTQTIPATAATSTQIAQPIQQTVEATPTPGIKLPKKFSSFSRNNHETWKPALFLEEPEDPLRRCHYRKQQVYPDGANIEYSPEELLARKYAKKLKNEAEDAPKTYVQIRDYESVKVVAYEQGQIEQQQHEERVFQQISTYNINEQHTIQQQQQQQQLPNLYISGNTNFYQLTGQNVENATYTYTSEAREEAEEDDDDEQEEAYDEDDDDEDAEDEVDDEVYDDEEEDDDVDDQQVQQRSTTTTTVVNTLDDLEDQIEASTIRFSMHSDQEGIQNKTIKIKFKKEPTQKVSSNKSNSSNNKNVNGSYSAYSVSLQNVYQNQQQRKHKQHQHHQHIKTNVNHLNSPEIRRNGHSFHPYMMSQTSTPKGAGIVQRKHNRSKVKKVSKFAIPNGSSSNSSSTENATGVGGGGRNLQNGHNASFQNATFNDNANYSFSSAAALDNSNCSLTSAVDRLNFRDSTFGGVGIGVAGHASKLHASNIADFSTYQENSYFATQHDIEAKERRLQKALTTIDTHFKKPAIDPFNSELCRALLTKLDFPNVVLNSENENETAESSLVSNLKIVQTPLPKLSNAKALYLPEAGNMQFNIDKEVGRGSYGSVYKATDVNTGTIVALKYQKPPNTWEIYICDQVLKRIKSPEILPGFMDISAAIIAPNASLIATEFSPFGSLLDINNKIRQNTTKVMHESLVMHFSAQICNIIYHLHQQKIIHADIKPDNFLLMRVPSTDSYLPSLRLIDFGCAIDMTLFPEPDKQKFRKVIQTDGFTCIEMQEGRTWSYETDIFCIAGTVHVMLFGEYMQVQKRAGIWDIKQKLPRYLKKHVWTRFFGEVLNIKNDKLPNLQEYRDIFDDEADKMDSELQKQIRTLSNILYRR